MPNICLHTVIMVLVQLNIKLINIFIKLSIVIIVFIIKKLLLARSFFNDLVNIIYIIFKCGFL